MAEKVLVIDRGNSLTKLMLFEGDRCVALHRLARPGDDEVLALAESFGASGGIYCSVGQMDVKLVESLRCLLPDDFMVLTHGTPVPIEVSYRPAEALGLDRVAALVGAWEKGMTEPVMVADAGTAITADLLLPPGRFGGGSIAPGIRLRLRSLHAFTARLPEITLREDVSPVCGDSTRESMLSGCVWGAAMELASRFAWLRRSCGVGRLVLAGGDARLLAARLKEIDPMIDIQVTPELVGIGLRKILTYNEQLS